MLDPFTSISLVSAIVQFVDFGIKVTSKSLEIYRSAEGLIAENVRLDEILTGINDLSERLARPQVGSHAAPISDDEKAVQKLAEASTKLAWEISALLESLRVSRVQEEVAKLPESSCEHLGKDKICELEEGLHAIQGQITHRLVYMMRYDSMLFCDSHFD